MSETEYTSPARRRRRPWRAPNNPTSPARQVWAVLFPGESWPRGWRIAWAGFMRGAVALTVYDEQRILLSWGDLRRPSRKRGPVEVLLHEFVHLRATHALRHGAEFLSLENGLRARLGFDPIGHGSWQPSPQARAAAMRFAVGQSVTCIISRQACVTASIRAIRRGRIYLDNGWSVPATWPSLEPVDAVAEVTR